MTLARGSHHIGDLIHCGPAVSPQHLLHGRNTSSLSKHAQKVTY